MAEDIIFKTRKYIKPEDLNAANTIFGGRLLSWIDEEAAIFAICQLEHKKIVTKIISEIDFKSPAYQGDIIEIGMQTLSFGHTSITLKAVVRNKDSKKEIVTIDKMVFVCLDNEGRPTPHSKKNK